MIITRTPLRVSLFGGTTDMPQWFQKHGGATIGFALSKYSYISVRHLPPFFEHRNRIVYSHIELTKTIAEIQHPAVRAILDQYQADHGLEIHYDGDLPARSGLGSSSSFAVGLIHALSALDGTMVTKRHLATEAIRIERDIMAETGGIQDQIYAAFGGFNRLDIDQAGAFTVSPVIMRQSGRDALLSRLMLFYTGQSRFASEVAAETVKSMPASSAQMHRIQAMVDDAQVALTANDLDRIGALLHEGWMLKRSLAAGVSNEAIDDIYARARAAGAVGGKLLGAGGGGFLLFYVPVDRHVDVRLALKELISVEVGLDTVGSTVLVYQP